jgi:hypothetical protein
LAAPIQRCDPRTSVARHSCLIIRKYALLLTLEDLLSRCHRPHLLPLSRRYACIPRDVPKDRVHNNLIMLWRPLPQHLMANYQVGSPSSTHTPRHRPPSRLANNIPRNSSPWREQQSPAAHSSTRPLALKCINCIGRRCEAWFHGFLVVGLRLITHHFSFFLFPLFRMALQRKHSARHAEHISRNYPCRGHRDI